MRDWAASLVVIDRPPIAAPKSMLGIRAWETKDKPAPIAKAAAKLPAALRPNRAKLLKPPAAITAPPALAKPAITAVAILFA